MTQCPVICLMGPTAAGKTALAAELHAALPVEIISVDSALIYKDMNIGTAKPSAEALKKTPHHLIDLCDPTENYSVGQFVEDIHRLIPDIQARGKVPLLVGGTMMYYNLLQNGVSKLPKEDPKLRQRILDEAKASGWQAMHKMLASIDPIAANRIHPNDPQRIQRALEVFLVTGKTMTEHIAQSPPEVADYRFVNLCLMPEDRPSLHEVINQRFLHMLSDGLIEEVQQLRQQYSLTDTMNSMRCVGYRQVWSYLDGEYNLETLKAKGMAATRQLAKRQMTWLRGWKDASFYAIEDPNMPLQVKSAIEKLLQAS